jgi:RNA polymerase sigma factor (sigma-70 family)
MTDSSRSIVYVVDDDHSVRSSVARLLQSSGFEVQTFASATDYLDQIAPDALGCLLLDLRMPGIDGLELQERLLRGGTARPIIFLTGRGTVPESVAAMKAGATDFLQKPADPEELVRAVRIAIETDRVRRREMEEMAAIEDRVSTLTPREREVFERVVQGRLNKQIAHELGVSEKTVKVHRGRVMEKMQTASLADLARLAERLGIGAPPA